MIICDQCGSANESGESFCGVCGAYLEWEDKTTEPAAAEVEPTPPEEEQAPEPEPAPARTTLLDRVKAATGLVDAPAADVSPSTPNAPGTPVAQDAPAVPGAEKAPGEVRGSAAADGKIAGAAAGAVTAGSASKAAASKPAIAKAAMAKATTAKSATAKSATAKLATPTKPGAPIKKAVAAVRPGVAAPKPRRRDLPPEDRAPLPGETVCPACGAGNVATRRFCRRCGTDLVDAAVVPELPWYRRLFRRSPKAGPLAGDRPKRRRRHRGYRRLVGVIIALVVVGAGAWYALPYTGTAGNAIKDRISGSQVVNPASIAASSAQKGHPAAALRDGATNKYWSPEPTGAGKGQYIHATFADPIRLISMQVFNGSSEIPKDYLTTARVNTFAITVTLEDGQTQKLNPATLADSPGPQEIAIGVSNVTGIRLTVESAYGAAPNRRLAVGEIAFFKRS